MNVKFRICKQASDCSLEGGRKMKKCKLVQNIRNFKFCYFIILHNDMFGCFSCFHICPRKF